MQSKRHILFILVFAVSIFSLTGCMNFLQQKEETAKPATSAATDEEIIGEAVLPAGFTLYKNLVYGLEMGYPNDWEMLENYYGSIVMFLAPIENDSDIFQENVNIITEDLPDTSITIDEYLDVSLEQIEALVTDFNLIENTALTVNGNPAYKIVYSGTEEDIYNIQWMQILTIKDTTAYVITFTAEATEFAKYQDTIDKMISTFALI